MLKIKITKKQQRGTDKTIAYLRNKLLAERFALSEKYRALNLLQGKL